MLRRVLLTVVALAVSSAWAQAVVTVDVDAGVHAISPLIYGINFVTSDQAPQGGITLTRWGGNSTTRYNYRDDVSNTAADWYFENIPGCWNSGGTCPPANTQTDSSANAFIDAGMALQLAMFINMPTLGWVPAPPPVYQHPLPCGCPRTTYPTQDSFDPWDSNCGDGLRGGFEFSCNDPTATSIAEDAGTWDHDWAAYLVSRYGPSNGRRIYELDNEPMLWTSTHRDVRGADAGLGYDELWARMRHSAVAILQADPSAQIAGPVEWGWTNYFCSDLDVVTGSCLATSPDRAAHGGEELDAWLLDQAQAYQTATGQRILHYLDLHYYAQGGPVPQTTRSLWDPTYVDPSWINDTIQLIPRMKAWVNQHYPGTKIALSEYDLSDFSTGTGVSVHNTDLGAVTFAEVLGIFGREGLDAATMWGAPATTDMAFAAFKLYRNYDGAGARFGGTSVQATVSGRTTVQAYAAADPAKLTVALVNEASTPATVQVQLAGFPSGRTARYFERPLGGATLGLAATPAINSGAVSVTVGATTIGMLEVPSLTAGGDAGITADGGTGSGGGKHSCGCSSGGSSAFLLMIALLNVAVLRKRAHP